jgi:hypothetical protein
MQKLRLMAVLPILLTVAWVDGNMTLPGEMHRLFQNKLGWPWLSFEESSVLARALIDVILSVAAYSLTFVTPRKFQLLVSGLALFVVMSCWQYTGIALWSFPTPHYFSDVFYCVLLAFALYAGFRLKALIPLAFAFLMTPFMSLDRLLFSLVTLTFLTILFKFRPLGKANGA